MVRRKKKKLDVPMMLPKPLSLTISSSSSSSSEGMPMSSPSGSITSITSKSPKGKPRGCPSVSFSSNTRAVVVILGVAEAGGARKSRIQCEWLTAHKVLAKTVDLLVDAMNLYVTGCPID